jgi:cell division protease FtsH
MLWLDIWRAFRNDFGARLMFTRFNVVMALMVAYAGSGIAVASGPKIVSYSEFLSELRAGHLSEVQIGEQDLTGVLKSDPTHPRPESELTIKATRLPGVDESLLLKELQAQPVKFSGHITSGSGIGNLLSWILPFVLLGFIYSFAMRRMARAGGPLTFGKNRAKIHDESTRIQVTF